MKEIHRILRSYHIKQYKQKNRPRLYEVPTEDWIFLRHCDKDDINFIKDTLKKLRSGEINPKDYGVENELAWSKAHKRYKLGPLPKKEKKIKAKYTIPEPTVEQIMKNIVDIDPLPTPQRVNPTTTSQIVQVIDRRAFIEGEFTIVDKDNKEIPFKLNTVQEKYYDVVKAEYGKGMNGAREIILKARQEGFCASERSKVLTSDLKWIMLKNVEVGQNIIAVDENIPGGRGKGRKMKIAIVESKRNLQKEAFKLTMDNGEELILTAEHRLLMRKRGGDIAFWEKIENMRIGDRIRYITKPWGKTTLEDAWFSGLLDGEGSLRSKKSGGAEVMVCQTPGSVLDRIELYAQNSGFSYRKEWDRRKYGIFDGRSNFRNKPLGRIVFNRMNELFELIGKTRPSRFIGNYWWVGKDLPGKRSGKAWSKIISIEPIGIQKMVDLQTSEKTFILDGFVSHNSSLILAMFATDFITIPNSVSICISHDRGATEKLFRKVHHYIESYCQKNGFNVKEYLSVDTKSELENATNKAFFYIKTAGSKVGARGGTALNIHFSEAAFFESTEKITATEIIEATIQQVPQGRGMIFLESTGGDYGTYFQTAWEKAKRKEIVYKPRFFSWEEMYNDEYIEKKRMEYQTEEKFLTDYPRTDEEAFIHTGSPFFDRKILKWIRDNMEREPLRMGRLASDGELI